MRDFLKPVIRWVDHNRYLTLGLVLLVAVLGWSFGCESLTKSLTDGGADVDRAAFVAEAEELQAGLEKDAISLAARHTAEVAELEADLKSGEAKIAIGLDDLNRQDEQRRQLIDFVGTLVTSAAAGTFNPATAITGAASLGALLLGGGAVADNRRKDRVITTLKNGNGDTT